MNQIVTKTVRYRNKEIPVEELKPNSQIYVTVRCKHGERRTKWYRRHNLCRKCCAETGVYNTSPKGRKITWGHKISRAKKGKKFTKDHKKALVEVRKRKYCEDVGISLEDFVEFSSYSAGRFNFYLIVRDCINNNWDLSKVVLSGQESEILGILGWSMLDFKIRMESLFDADDRISWKTYGHKGWHVDHIKPVSKFHITSIYDDSFRKCWSLSNLQPLWCTNNLKKSNKYGKKSTT